MGFVVSSCFRMDIHSNFHFFMMWMCDFNCSGYNSDGHGSGHNGSQRTVVVAGSSINGNTNSCSQW